MCDCVLGWQNVTYHFRVTVTLTSDLVLINVVLGAYLILFEIGIPNLVCLHLGLTDCVMFQFVTLT